MRDENYTERVKRFSKYLESEISARRKVSADKINASETDFAALMSLYRCAWKDEASFEGLKYSGDRRFARSVQFLLNTLEIRNFSGLKEWASKIKHYAGFLSKIEADGIGAVTSSELDILMSLKERPRVVRSLLTIMSLFCENCSDDFSPKSLLAEYLAVIHTGNVQSLYKNLLLALIPERSEKNKEPESKSQSQNEASESQSSNENSAPANQTDILRSQLEEAYTRLNESEKQRRILMQEGKEAAINEVLAIMNSQEAGMLIDLCAKCEKTLKDFAQKGITLPEEYTPLSTCVKVFMRIMRNVFEITPVFETGEILEANLEQAQEYIYTGSEFSDSEEVKKVKVTAPGWKRKEEIFSRPHVVEVS